MTGYNKGASEITVEKRNSNTYAIEMTAIFVSGLGMMLLLATSFLLVSYLVVSSNRDVTSSLGSSTSFFEDSNKIAFFSNLRAGSGQVAGVVDDSTVEESNLRNQAADWFSEARRNQGMTAPYRDGVLDRNAQNQARLMSDRCDSHVYSNWSEMLGTRLDEGYIVAFSEAAFSVNSSSSLASDLVQSPVDYSRLFTGYTAYGVGVVKTPITSTCDSSYIAVFQMADIN